MKEPDLNKYIQEAPITKSRKLSPVMRFLITPIGSKLWKKANRQKTATMQA